MQSHDIGFFGYGFLVVINVARGRILHRFRDIAFDMSNVAIWLRYILQKVLLRFTFFGGVPWDDLRKILPDGQRIGRLQNGVENCRKFQPAE